MEQSNSAGAGQAPRTKRPVVVRETAAQRYLRLSRADMQRWTELVLENFVGVHFIDSFRDDDPHRQPQLVFRPSIQDLSPDEPGWRMMVVGSEEWSPELVWVPHREFERFRDTGHWRFRHRPPATFGILGCRGEGWPCLYRPRPGDPLEVSEGEIQISYLTSDRFAVAARGRMWRLLDQITTKKTKYVVWPSGAPLTQRPMHWAGLDAVAWSLAAPGRVLGFHPYRDVDHAQVAEEWRPPA